MSPARPGRLAGAAALAAVALTVLPAAAQAGFGDRALERGHRGHDVRVLQSWLTHLGFPTGIDGSFGTGTEQSVERYEAKNRLERDGMVSRGQARRMRRQVEDGRERRPADGGRSTERTYSFGERTLRRGHRGHDVRVLQSWLGKLGIPTQVDGSFGAGTEQSLKRYEALNELEQDGQLTPAEAQRMRRQVEDGEQMPNSGEPVAQAQGHVFPVRGSHRYGDGFGAGRGHRGQDVFAACGTPLVAAQGGRVEYAGFHSAAGHYVVITGSESKEDYVYMHLRGAPLVGRGASVRTGQAIGEVGESGNADGCHLHFELWTAPGWYKGGEPYDPAPALREWDRAGPETNAAGR